MVQYHIQSSGFYIQAVPQGTFLLEDADNVINAFSLDLAFGAGYQITFNLLVEAKYSFEVTNRTSEDFGNNLKSRINALGIGLGYKF